MILFIEKKKPECVEADQSILQNIPTQCWLQNNYKMQTFADTLLSQHTTQSRVTVTKCCVRLSAL